MALTAHQVATLIVIERVTASISVFFTLFLLTSFIFFKAFRTLSNTLIFYASFANLFANVAALIGGSALSNVNGALCQFQGFLLEMFMQSDPMWSCAMAVNVYLVFFRRYDAARLKKLYWIYGIICYGLPFIPAIFCLFYKTREKGKMYGNATLWCWIDNDWAAIRIYSYYAPIWVSILCALAIYTRVGVEIFQKRSQLRAAARSNHYEYGSGTLTSISDAKFPDTRPPPIVGIRTTEVEVTHYRPDPWSKGMGGGNLESPAQVYGGDAGARTTSRTEKHAGRTQEYTITISAHDRPPPTPRAAGFARRPSSMDKVKWAYTKCALLFAISILITWVPASVNRVYGLRYPKHPSFALNVGSAIVLPLQGFWNTIIYFSTSLSICRSVWEELKNERKRGREEKKEGFKMLDVVRGEDRRVRKTDSMRELGRTRSDERSLPDSF